MKLDENINYIVSGLERSGTSMLMQILKAGGAPLAFDTESRPPDDNNPKGYFELEGGKIINKLMEEDFPFSDYKGKFIKITAYGLKFLPVGKYRVIYSKREIEEILDSMDKMAKITDENRAETKELFINLNNMIMDLISNRDDVEVLFADYNAILSEPEPNIRKIYDFLGTEEADLDAMLGCVDKRLYRNRRKR
jgi:hypothetical protein